MKITNIYNTIQINKFKKKKKCNYLQTKLLIN